MTQETASATNIISYETRYGVMKEIYFATAERQFSYGKWLLASLLTVHAGSLLAISQAGEKTAKLYQACGPLLIYGVASTLICGGLAWINFSVAANVYVKAMNDLRHAQEPNPTKLTRLLSGLTLWVTPFVACLSLGLFLFAAIRATSIL